MRRLAPLLLLLAACGREAPPPPETLPSFRTAGAPIGSTTRGTTADLLGDWVVSEAMPGAVPGALARAGSRIALTDAGGATVLWRIDGADLALVEDGPGRFRSGDLRLWVLWVDDDFRTAVVGNPEGTLGWIMDRPGEASPDRTLSARAILRFNGYDAGRLAAR